ncbi:MAG: alpha/beta hydrolase [Hyphomonadaceae bacterium]|nr:alpha/beta hydrolase [Hyphomonadaceae bacterium]
MVASKGFQKVKFPSGDSYCVGDLYLPAHSPAPAVTIIGPMTYQKEQAPTQYARRLADLGYAALAFDARYRGESGGMPRCWENPAAKVEDLHSSIEYLASRPEIDPGRIFVLGVCQGSSEALKAAAESPRVKGLATIAGHYRDHQGDIDWLTQEGFDARKAAGLTARRKYDLTGEVDYVPGVDDVDMNVGMPGKFVWDWYHHWADRGDWENRYAVMSDADLLDYESISAARNITKPWMMIHGDLCFLPSAARRHFDAIQKGTRSALVWADTPHLDYYDKPEIIDPTARRVADWFGHA